MNMIRRLDFQVEIQQFKKFSLSFIFVFLKQCSIRQAKLQI